jgi:hypothetical protein
MRHDIAGRIIVIDKYASGGSPSKHTHDPHMQFPIGEDVIEFYVL